jgi:hypothetical protein
MMCLLRLLTLLSFPLFHLLNRSTMLLDHSSARHGPWLIIVHHLAVTVACIHSHHCNHISQQWLDDTLYHKGCLAP